MNFSKLLPVLAIATAIFGVTVVNSFADVSKDHRIKFCETKKNKKYWQKGHYAFAANAEGDRCGYAWNHSTKKSAIFRAIRGCEKKAKGPCKIVYAE